MLQTDAFAQVTLDYIVAIACALMGLRKVATEDWAEVCITHPSGLDAMFTLCEFGRWSVISRGDRC